VAEVDLPGTHAAGVLPGDQHAGSVRTDSVRTDAL
jgi:hypothetical protein